MKAAHLLSLCLLAFPLVAVAQNRAEGTVTDESGKPLAGILVTLQGTGYSTLTDLEGSFVLEGIELGSILEFSGIGYKTQNHTWGNRPLKVVLKDKGYGTVFAFGTVGIAGSMTFGAMAGYVDRLGFYVKARHNFNFVKSDLSAYDLGETLSDGTALWTKAGAKTTRSVMQLGAGVMVRATKWLYPYVGASYRISNFFVESYNGEMVKLSRYSGKDLGLDAGAAFRFGKFGVSGGANYYFGSGTLVAEAGLGLFF